MAYHHTIITTNHQHQQYTQFQGKSHNFTVAPQYTFYNPLTNSNEQFHLISQIQRTHFENKHKHSKYTNIDPGTFQFQYSWPSRSTTETNLQCGVKMCSLQLADEITGGRSVRKTPPPVMIIPNLFPCRQRTLVTSTKNCYRCLGIEQWLLIGLNLINFRTRLLTYYQKRCTLFGRFLRNEVNCLRLKKCDRDYSLRAHTFVGELVVLVVLLICAGL